MGLRDQNNGKKIGINGSRIYHVTTLKTTLISRPICILEDVKHNRDLWHQVYLGNLQTAKYHAISFQFMFERQEGLPAVSDLRQRFLPLKIVQPHV